MMYLSARAPRLEIIKLHILYSSSATTYQSLIDIYLSKIVAKSNKGDPPW